MITEQETKDIENMLNEKPQLPSSVFEPSELEAILDWAGHMCQTPNWKNSDILNGVVSKVKTLEGINIQYYKGS
tara:strand:+ start:543 stop:764 length:222 start_codon:yes stop_codon:yes gene_type:complete